MDIKQSVEQSFSTIQDGLGHVDIGLVLAGGSAVLLVFGLYLATRKRANDGAPEPPMLPGHVPVLGHAILWFKDSSQVHQRARKWSTNLEPVSINLMGQKAYIILHPRDFAAVHRSRTLQFDPIVQWSLSTHFGMSVKATHDISGDPDGEGSMYVNEHAFFRDALGPGDNLNNLTDIFLGLLRKDMAANVSAVRDNGGAFVVNLMDWTRDTIGRASSNAVVGSAILESNPDLLKWNSQWQNDFFTFSFGLPRWLMRKAYANRDRILDAFARHTYDKEALWFVGAREKLMEARGVLGKDMGALTFAFWTGLQANAIPTSFWLLHYIAHSPGTAERIRAEIAPAFDSSNSMINLNHLLHHAPLLNSMFQETLRCTSGVVSMRKATEDTVINGYLLKKDAMIMLPGRPAHFAEDLWGGDVDTFIPDRFLAETSKPKFSNITTPTTSPINKEASAEKRKHPGTKGVRPFGGGNTLCPGRFFASNEVLSYVATVLWLFDLEVPEGESMARVDTATPTVGTYLPDRAVWMRLRVREERNA